MNVENALKQALIEDYQAKAADARRRSMLAETLDDKRALEAIAKNWEYLAAITQRVSDAD